LALAVDRVGIDLLDQEAFELPHEVPELRPLRRRFGERVDEVEAETSEVDLLQERRGLPLGLARLFGDPARLGGADGARLRFRHEPFTVQQAAARTLEPLDNKYLSYDAQRAPKVREMFSRIAWKYDLVNDVMSFGLHRRWKRQTVALAVPGASARRVLDL